MTLKNELINRNFFVKMEKFENRPSLNFFRGKELFCENFDLNKKSFFTKFENDKISHRKRFHTDRGKVSQKFPTIKFFLISPNIENVARCKNWEVHPLISSFIQTARSRQI